MPRKQGSLGILNAPAARIESIDARVKVGMIPIKTPRAILMASSSGSAGCLYNFSLIYLNNRVISRNFFILSFDMA